jgi:hypothetical protein
MNGRALAVRAMSCRGGSKLQPPPLGHFSYAIAEFLLQLFWDNRPSGLDMCELGETRGVSKLTAPVALRKRPACRVTATLGPQNLH